MGAKKPPKLNLPWLRHYTNALSESEGLSSLFNELGHEGYGLYWLFVEFLNREYRGVPHIVVQLDELKHALRISHTKKILKFMQALESNFSGFEIKFEENSNKFLEIRFPKLSELCGKQKIKPFSDSNLEHIDFEFESAEQTLSFENNQLCGIDKFAEKYRDIMAGLTLDDFKEIEAHFISVGGVVDKSKKKIKNIDKYVLKTLTNSRKKMRHET